MKKFDAVFFDFDGTLYNAETTYRIGLRFAWKEWRRYEPVSWPEFLSLYARARLLVKQRLSPHPTARSRHLYVKAMTELRFGHTRPRMILNVMSAYDKCWKTISWEPAKQILRALRPHYRLGLITNLVSEMQMKKLNELDPNGLFFDAVVTSEEMGVEKPARKIFREACARVGCAPRKSLMVGDSRKTDVQGALRAGLSAALLDRRHPTKAGPRFFQIRYLADLISILK